MGKSESYWGIIKNVIKKFLESESSEDGKINFIFGIFVFILVFAICIPSTLITIICIFFPKLSELLMPWYGVVIVFGFAIIYFMYCSGKLIKIKNRIKEYTSDK